MIEYIIIAILQGLTEWLPISSSGQVMIFSLNILDISPEQAYSLSIWLHLGTMFAVILRFRKDYYGIIKSFIPNKVKMDQRDVKKRNWIIITTVGTAITAVPLYLIFRVLILGTYSADQGDVLTLIISSFLIITGIILLVFKKKYGRKTIDGISNKELNRDSFIAGLIQGFAILPGISRSGVTVSTLLIENYEQDHSLNLSFLMSVPVILASIGVDLIFGEGSIFGSLDIPTILVITIVSFLVGYLTMEILLRVARKVNFGYFCILYGVLAFIIIVPFLI
ncbi:MAG: undecaprenyl-diphosphate phosphatase [Promethearchaeota archaeon]